MEIAHIERKLVSKIEFLKVVAVAAKAVRGNAAAKAVSADAVAITALIKLIKSICVEIVVTYLQ